MDGIFAALGTIGAFLVHFVLAYVFVLAVVIFIHELGHYLAGRLFGVRVLSFSLGFGPEIFGFDDRRGTRWKLAAIPLGGYVKFHGDADGASRPDDAAIAAMSEAERAGSFHLKPVWQRAIIVAAGPLANFALAIAIFAGLFMVEGRSYVVPVAAEAREGSRAAEAGFLPGDTILSINGTSVRSVADFVSTIQINAETPLRISVDRAGAPLDLVVTPARVVQDTVFGPVSVGQIGLSLDGAPQHRRFEELSLGQSVVAAVEECEVILRQTLTFLGRLFTGRENLDQMNGPVGIANITGQVAKMGVDNLIWLAAVLSFSIGLINLFPIPVLDGGHLLFYLVEAIRRRPLPAAAQELSYRVGFALILTLLVVVSFNDVRKLVSVFAG
jgi:regulator of sigma E protease